MQLTQTKEVHDLPGLGVHLVDTFCSDDQQWAIANRVKQELQEALNHHPGRVVKSACANRTVETQITTLRPFTAAQAEHHLAVAKNTRDGRTYTEVTDLADSKRIDEVARMLGGKSDAAEKHAKELLER